jgi:hypothetical protein
MIAGKNSKWASTMARVPAKDLSEFKHVDWQASARKFLLKNLAGVKYRTLAENLAKMGIRETDRTIATKLSRGKFAFTFFLQCLVAQGIEISRWTEEEFPESRPVATLRPPEQP